MNERFLDFDLLSGYDDILNGMEHHVCDGGPLAIQMVQSYLDWCFSVTRVCETIHINDQSPGLLQLLPDIIESLGEAFSDWLGTHGVFPLDASVIATIGVWALFSYEGFIKNPNPKNFNFYAFIRSNHPDIDSIGKERDALEKKAEYDKAANDRYDILSAHFLKESEKYWDEAVAEKKRLVEHYKHITVEGLVLTKREMGRVTSDIAFVLDPQTTKADLRKRLQDYHRLDITEDDKFYLS